MKFLYVLCVLCGLNLPAIALDREAFTFTNYNLNVRIEPEQQRLAARGTITLRNDSSVPQKNLSLQISSTLDWRSIRAEGKPVQFVSQPYTSDIDHTGAVSEAIVTLPKEVLAKASVELEVGYEGTIPLDTTRLTRIGVPEEQAKHSDWDQISSSFTAVRGFGYVVWYPVAMEAANLSEESSVPRTVGGWIVRHRNTRMDLLFESTSDADIFFSGTPDLATVFTEPSVKKVRAFSMVKPGVSVPMFVIAKYQKIAPQDFLDIQFLPGQEEAAKEYSETVSQIDPIVAVGRGSERLQVLDLPDPDAASFVSEGLLLTPLKSPVKDEATLDFVYAKARQSMHTSRAWIVEGLSHYAQAVFIEANLGHRRALDYLDAHKTVLVEAERPSNSGATKALSSKANDSLIDAPDDVYLQTKAMYVWWMLGDMLGGLPNGALLSYQAVEDKDNAYLQRLIEKATHRDLQWFFEDWIYHDRGLPEFRVDSVYSRPIPKGGHMVTVTIENRGEAGAEVPLSLRFEGGEVTKRLEVRARSKASIRIEAPAAPRDVVVNDGSVPELDTSNNLYKIESLNH
jgi:hypothetical protein